MDDVASGNGRLYYKHNRVKQLRAFCFTEQSGSISKAAERLSLSQPSVSLQIQALERELGIVLFERRGPRIRLTPEGQALYEIALPLVEGVDTLPERFHARHQSLHHGTLDVAAGESTTLYILPDLLSEFMARYPSVRVRLHNLVGNDMVNALRNDEVDFSVGSMLDLPEDMVYRAVYSYELKLLVPNDHPLSTKADITLEDIAAADLILPPRHLTTWRLVSIVFQQHSIPYNVKLEVGGWEIMKRYVERGFGIGIASSICLGDDQRFTVRALPQAFPQRTYGFMHRRGKFLSPQAKRFIELMRPAYFTDEGEYQSHENAQESIFVAASDSR